ncbi:MAG: anthranilate phosphoribosyltransferase [bacterium]|nr:anthranilate phosphoribosyltransferase [bacterium]
MERAEFIRDRLAVIFPPPAGQAGGELLALGRLLAAGAPLPPADAGRAIGIMMDGRSADHEAALFLAAFDPGRCTAETLAAMARAMLERAVRVTPSRPYPVLGDSCGTGGDNLHLFNVSTAAMFIMAAAGAPIAKHGNRASTSRCGSADVLEALGVRIDLGPEGVARCLDRAGIGFIFAPRYHPAMRRVAAVRKALPFRTVFNILGPLCNPAPLTFQLLGVPHPGLIGPVAGALLILGRGRALVVCGETGGEGSWMDEVSIAGPTDAALVEGGTVRATRLTPEALGAGRCGIGPLGGGTPAENAAILRRVLAGDHGGPVERICLANAAAGLYAAGAVRGLDEGMRAARAALEGGGALERLDLLIEESGLAEP